MKAVAVFPGSREVRVIQREPPRLGQPDQVMLRVVDVGICGTDAEISSFQYGTPPSGQDHLVIGHECLTEVVEVGSLVSHVHVKDLVFKDTDAPFRASDTARVKAEERAVMSRVVGSGVLPWADIIGELTRRGYDDVLTLEYEYRWHPQDLPEPAVGFAESARVLRSILASLEDDR